MRRIRSLATVVRWVGLGLVVGALAGVSSAAFLTALEWATDTRGERQWLLWLLPLVGLAVGFTYHRFAGAAARGNNLILDEIHQPTQRVPARMAPMVFAATVATHLCGGSAGREGTAIQMSGSLSDALLARVVRLASTDRRVVLIAAISGGFGAVFGVPIAGCIFGLEVQSAGRIRHDAIVPALVASVVGDQVVRLLDVAHTPLPVIGAIDFTAGLAFKLVLAGVAFGLVAFVFIELTHALKRVFGRAIVWPPLRPFVGGWVVIGLTYLVGTRDYLGLSVPLITDSVGGVVAVATFAFAWKLLFTAVTLGAGFQGGEVTPLFVIGATLGAVLGDALNAPIPLLAAVGLVAVFSGATNTPIACTVMGVELFGSAIIVPLAIGAVVANVVSGRRSIYTSQRVASARSTAVDHDAEFL
ncbi:MAG TPA: chloride channel protein [Ilumatobacter sp.]|nr:chloride channel protein [Ilumatobacter sp.]